MKASLDVDYRAAEAVASCVLFHEWADERPAHELVARTPSPAAYRPGELYLRELPCLLAVLAAASAFRLEVVVVDGYVWLDGHGRRGLGAHLHAALGGRVPVIGVAKTAFAGAGFAIPVWRGRSKRPLYVTAVGCDAAAAARSVAEMHGANRIPALLARADRRAREG